jgi:diguanylate cyclase (GGDEF)-like protein
VINDSLGHTSGDRLLVALGKRLSECLRVSDTVARLGGDEFVILLGGVSNIESVTLTANRIQHALSQPFCLGDRQVYVTASIGIVLGLHEYKKPEDVLRDADLAMYRAKGTGKNRYEFFVSSMREQAISRLDMENELRSGLKDSQFCLFYQPILSLDSGKLIGFEALIRWNHPARGLLSPADFLPVAEESGLIIPIGYWVLQEACSQVCRWQENFNTEQPLSINVNISLKQFTQADFIPQVQRVLAETGLDPSRLHLEITESVLIDNTASARETFEALNKMGIQLQVDDFGTGYSSLSYLHQFPIHSIKIDRSFIREIVQGEKNHDLVRTMVMMAGNMGMDSIAEGVETDEQMQILKDLGCKYGQGYLIARPMGSEPARAWMEAHIM